MAQDISDPTPVTRAVSVKRTAAIRIGTGLNVFYPLHATVVVKYELLDKCKGSETMGNLEFWVSRMRIFVLLGLDERRTTTAVVMGNAE